MRELLYLKDEQIKDFIEKNVIVYRDTLSYAKISLNKKHHQDELEHHGRVIDDLQKKLKTAEAKNAVLEDKLKSKRKK